MKNKEKYPWDTNIEWLMFCVGMAAGISIANIILAILKLAILK